jgi:hypothetical protein
MGLSADVDVTQGNWMLSGVALKHMLEHYGENNACYNSCHKSDEVAPVLYVSCQ